MAENTKIEWTDSTFNSWRGCTKVSPGCTNCYADRQSHRNPNVLGVWGPQGTRVLASEAQWKLPHKWNEDYQWERDPNNPFLAKPATKRHRVFCASLADIFEDWQGQMTNSQGRWLYYNHDQTRIQESAQSPESSVLPNFGFVPYTLNHARARLWKLIKLAPALDWLILTKRPENIAKMMPHGKWDNVWLGVSVENQEYSWRCDALLEAQDYIKTPVRFVSYEPALAALDLSPCLGKDGVNWVIVGGESGALTDVREFEVEWALAMIEQCKRAGVACFIKQLGRITYQADPKDDGTYFIPPLPLKDLKGGDMEEWADELKVREFPV